MNNDFFEPAADTHVDSNHLIFFVLLSVFPFVVCFSFFGCFILLYRFVNKIKVLFDLL